MAAPATPVVVVGTGSIGTRHLEVLGKRVGWALPVRAPRRKKWQRAGYTTVGSLEEAWKKGARACVIATDTRRHLADAKKAVRLGFHTLVEKPLAADRREAVELLKLAKKKKRKLFTACVLRFSKSLNDLRARAARIGKVHSVRIECQSYLPDWRPKRDFRKSYSARAADGGVLRDLVHEVDYAGWIFGWPSSLTAQLANHDQLRIKSEESADLWWETKQGTTVTIRLDYLTRPTRRHVVICGERGMLKWDGAANLVVWLPPKGEISQFSIPQERNDMFARQLKEFLNAVNGKKTYLLASGEDGARAMAICDAARLSWKLRKHVKVAY